RRPPEVRAPSGAAPGTGTAGLRRRQLVPGTAHSCATRHPHDDTFAGEAAPHVPPKERSQPFLVIRVPRVKWRKATSTSCAPELSFERWLFESLRRRCRNRRRMRRLIEPDSGSPRQTESGDRSPPCLLDIRQPDSSRLEYAHIGLEVG